MGASGDAGSRVAVPRAGGDASIGAIAEGHVVSFPGAENVLQQVEVMVAHSCVPSVGVLYGT